MMLLTFQHYAEIPEKIHVFYDLAFDTLFSKHDALKEAFSRKKYTSLAIDVFKRRLSFFFLISYIEEKFTFTRSELIEIINKSARLDGVEIDADAFSRDLLESVCLMQIDGLAIVFTHRSFQEYFTAYCLSRMPSAKLSALVPKIAERRTDNVISMLSDMNRDLIEEAYILPMILKAKLRLREINPKTALEIANSFEMQIVVEQVGSAFKTYQRQEDGFQLANFFFLSQALYPDLFRSVTNNMKRFHDMDDAMEKEFPIKPSPKTNNRRRFSLIGRSGSFQPVALHSQISEGRTPLEDSELGEVSIWFEKTGHAAYLRECFKAFRKFLTEIPKRNEARGKSLEELLGI